MARNLNTHLGIHGLRQQHAIIGMSLNVQGMLIPHNRRHLLSILSEIKQSWFVYRTSQWRIKINRGYEGYGMGQDAQDGVGLRKDKW